MRVADLGMWSFEGSTGSLWGRAVAVSAPGSDVWASSCGVWLTWQLPVWWDLLRRYPNPMLLLQGPGQVSVVHSEEKVISVIVYTVLVNYPLDVASSFFFLGFHSGQFVPETGLAGSSSIIFGGSVASFLLFFIIFAHSLLLPQPFCKTCSVSGFLE